jgi:hypothetical protein
MVTSYGRLPHLVEAGYISIYSHLPCFPRPLSNLFTRSQPAFIAMDIMLRDIRVVALLVLRFFVRVLALIATAR